MKKLIGWIIIIIISIGSILIVDKKSDIYNIGQGYEDVEFKIKFKGLKEATDFTMSNGKIYISFPKKIRCYENGKEPYDILEDSNLNIKTIEQSGENIYFITDNRLMSVNINSGKIKECINNIPNKGDYDEVLLKAYKDYLFITIGSMTNSGIVGGDNVWANENSSGCDISPFTIKLRENKVGAFVPKGNSNTSNQVIKGQEIGNSSIILFNVNTFEYETYAWGIRNIEGIDVTDDGRVFVTVGGYEDRGERPIENDSDYIYEIKKGYWYGFPDYSGGDPLSSPRFNSQVNDIKPLMAEYPMNPPAPYYQYKDVDSLKWIVIDEVGNISKNNQKTIFLYNKENNNIYQSLIGGVFEPFIELNSNCTASSMKIEEDKLYILDSNNGFLFTVENES